MTRGRPASRIARADRPWLSTEIMAVLGPLRMPGRADLVEALVTLARRYPQERIGWTASPDGRRWLHDPERLRATVEESVVAWSDDPTDYQDVLGRLRDLPRRAGGFVMVVMPTHVGLKVSHALGDGRLLERWLSGAVALAQQDRMPEWDGGVRRPLSTALAAVARRQPAVLTRQVIGAVRRRPAPSTVPAAAQPSRPWTDDQVTVNALADRDAVRRLRQWRRTSAPDVSPVALEFALVLRALAGAGVPLRPEMLVLYDLRRYLGGRTVHGNFVVGIQHALPATAALEEIDATVSGTAASGRPLLTFLAGLLRPPGPPPTRVPDPAGVQIAFTHLGRSRDIEHLGWTGDTRRYVGSVTPAGPEGVTVALSGLGGLLHYSLTFHRNVFDPERISAAMQRACADPVATLAAGARVAQGPAGWESVS